MHTTNKVTMTGTAAALMALAIGAISMTGSVAHAQQSEDPNCGSIVHYPGAVTVTGKAFGTAEAGDFRSCTTTYRCDSNARKVEVFGYGYASDRAGVIASENYAVATNSAEAVLSSCEASARSGGGLHQARACLAEPQQFQSQEAVAEQADCTVVVGAPAGGSTIASSTCFCEG
ncbi:hypothetical protein [Luteimonas sp. R10]|uniref:hypothetical protein n=1 Tax=Luteimonas sp. R10 TaxID=3108176 RepID=UPI003091DEFA|nr:hypothetical protein U3649_14590 [Luteimonas sp. R10]